ncbi:MAG: RNA 2',3'-cyclic phosphodiesterase [Rhodocyclaceae bacterium]|nr:RNA 2',3'-cyclic phosphodiesterase [Rhodocyclaceae bacterium]
MPAFGAAHPGVALMGAHPGPPPGAAADERLRVYFALWPPAEVAAQLGAWQQVLHAALGGRIMRPDGLHVTLAFVGDIAAPRLPELLEIGARAGAPAASLCLDQAGAWRHNRIGWAGTRAVPPALAGLAAALADALRGAGFSVESRPWVPHVTLLRNVVRCAPVPQDLAPVRWDVSGFCLVRSRLDARGARYERLAGWPRR